MEQFFASMGQNETNGGRSPFQINFNFAEQKVQRSTMKTETTATTGMTDVSVESWPSDLLPPLSRKQAAEIGEILCF